MVALLAADGLSGYPLSRLAQVGSGAVYAILARLEALGWAESDFDRREGTGLRRRLYVLTPKGRANVTILLGLPAEAARLTPEANGA
jgi:DNA-binding PadR family transcriptional regulator